MDVPPGLALGCQSRWRAPKGRVLARERGEPASTRPEYARGMREARSCGALPRERPAATR